MKKWYKLDNLGNFYASTTSDKNPKVFRLSAQLTEEINEFDLQKALNMTIGVYPNFNVNLKKGFFWFYLDETNKINKVTKENLPICFRLYNTSDDFLYRVSYYKKRINFEVAHIISDGRGSVEFFKQLLTNYINIRCHMNIIDSNNSSILEKTEDSFNKYYQKPKFSKSKNQVPFRYRGKKYPNQTRFMECNLNVKEVLELAHKYDTTLTCMLVSILIYSFKDQLKTSDMNKYIKIDIPVDLRGYFNSSTTMNFFGLTTVLYKFNSTDDKIEDIIKEVKIQFKEKLIKDKLTERVNLMVWFEKNIFSRIAPIFLKNLTIKLTNNITFKNCTTSFSNLGIIKLHPKIEEKIDNISVLTATTGFQFTCCTLKDKLCIGISSRFVNNDVIKNFCRFFSYNKIKVEMNVSEVEQ